MPLKESYTDALDIPHPCVAAFEVAHIEHPEHDQGTERAVQEWLRRILKTAGDNIPEDWD